MAAFGNRSNPVTAQNLVSSQVYGVPEMLKALKDIDPQLRKATVARMKAAAKPMVDEARSLVPEAAPLTEWGNWKGGYDARAIRKGIKVSFKGSRKRVKYLEWFPLLKLVNSNAVGSIVDIAGRAGGHGRGSEAKKRGDEMIRKITREMNKDASRIAWLAAERRMPMVQAEVNAAIEDMEFIIQKRMNEGRY